MVQLITALYIKYLCSFVLKASLLGMVVELPVLFQLLIPVSCLL